MRKGREKIALLFAAAFGIGLSTSVLLRSGSAGGVEENALKPDKQNLPSIVLAGKTGLSGEGVRISIDDNKIRAGNGLDENRLLVHERHLLFLVNELSAAGAEGISINEERVVAVTAIRCVGPAIRINDTNKVPPFEVLAIGDKDILTGAVMMMGGVVDSLSRQGMKVDVSKDDNIEIKPYRGKFDVRFARSEWK